MDTWHCLKAGRRPGGLGLLVKVNGRQGFSPSPKGGTVAGSPVLKRGHSLALPRMGFQSTCKSKSDVISSVRSSQITSLSIPRTKSTTRRQNAELERGRSPDNILKSCAFLASLPYVVVKWPDQIFLGCISCYLTLKAPYLGLPWLTPHSQFRGLGSIPGQGTRSYIPQLRVHPTTKDPACPTETQCQINKQKQRHST